MPYGSLSGLTKNWTDKEVNDAKQAGIFLETPKATTTPVKPLLTTPVKPITGTVGNTQTGAVLSNTANTAQQLGNFVSTPIPSVKTNAVTPVNSVSTPIPSVQATPVTPVSVPAQNIVGAPAPPVAPVAPLTDAPPVTPQVTMPSIQDVFSQLKDLIMPQTPQVQAYDSPYSQQIADALSKWQTASSRPFTYNPNSDAGLKAAQQQAQQQTMREFARKNLLGSMSNQAQLDLANMALVPQYQEMAQQRNQQNLNNLAKNLELLQGMDTNAYNRYRTGVTDARDTANTAYTRNLALAELAGTQQQVQARAQQTAQEAQRTAQEAQRTAQAKALEARNKEYNDFLASQDMIRVPGTDEIVPTAEGLRKEKELGIKQSAEALKGKEALENSEKATFGFVLSDTARDYYSAYSDLFAQDEGFRQDLKNYQSNLAELKKLYIAEGKDEAAKAVEGARLLKISNSGDLLEKYGSEFGLANVSKTAYAMKQAELKTLVDEMDAEMKAIDYSVYDEKTRLDLQKAYADLKNLDLRNFAQAINNQYLEKGILADLKNKAIEGAQKLANIANDNARTQSSIANDAARTRAYVDNTESTIRDRSLDSEMKIIAANKKDIKDSVDAYNSAITKMFYKEETAPIDPNDPYAKYREGGSTTGVKKIDKEGVMGYLEQVLQQDKDPNIDKIVDEVQKYWGITDADYKKYAAKGNPARLQSGLASQASEYEKSKKGR